MCDTQHTQRDSSCATSTAQASCSSLALSSVDMAGHCAPGGSNGVYSAPFNFSPLTNTSSPPLINHYLATLNHYLVAQQHHQSSPQSHPPTSHSFIAHTPVSAPMQLNNGVAHAAPTSPTQATTGSMETMNNIRPQSSSPNTKPETHSVNGQLFISSNKLNKTSKKKNCKISSECNKSNKMCGKASPQMSSGLIAVDEDGKPCQSYIGLIAQAILSSSERRLVLSEIYGYILQKYPYFNERTGWRNSIRHNLSLNDCFVKGQRAANGKGHYWFIHPANLRDFMKGDFRRRRAQRKVRRHLGLRMLDTGLGDDEEDSEDEEFAAQFGQQFGPFGSHPLAQLSAFSAQFKLNLQHFQANLAQFGSMAPFSLSTPLPAAHPALMNALQTSTPSIPSTSTASVVQPTAPTPEEYFRYMGTLRRQFTNDSPKAPETITPCEEEDLQVDVCSEDVPRQDRVSTSSPVSAASLASNCGVVSLKRSAPDESVFMSPPPSTQPPISVEAQVGETPNHGSLAKGSQLLLNLHLLRQIMMQNSNENPSNTYSITPSKRQKFDMDSLLESECPKKLCN